MWYLFKIKFEGPKNKTIRESFLMNCDDPAAGHNKLKGLLKPRVKEFVCTNIAQAEFADILQYAGTKSIETAISFPFHEVVIDMWDHSDKYLVPADGHEQAVERALEASNMDDDRMKSYKPTGITGVWDNLSQFWMDDFRNRMDVREALHFHTPKEDPEDPKKKQVDLFPDEKKAKAPKNVDPDTGEEFPDMTFHPPIETDDQRIIRDLNDRKFNVPAVQNNGVVQRDTVAVEGEDLNNGVEPQPEEYFEAIVSNQLTSGNETLGLPDPNEAGDPPTKAKTRKRPAKRKKGWVPAEA